MRDDDTNILDCLVFIFILLVGFLCLCYIANTTEQTKYVEGEVVKKLYIPSATEKVEKFKRMGKTGVWVVEDEYFPEKFIIEVQYSINNEIKTRKIYLKKEEWEEKRINDKYILTGGRL